MSNLGLHICCCDPKCLRHAGFCPTCDLCGQYIDVIFWKYVPFDDPESRKLVAQFAARQRREGVTA
jgi:hypothetical protein